LVDEQKWISMRDMLEDLVDVRWGQGLGCRQVGLAGLGIFAADQLAFHVNQALGNSPCYRLFAIQHSKLADDVAEMKVSGTFTNSKLSSNIDAGESMCTHKKALYFASAQRSPARRWWEFEIQDVRDEQLVEILAERHDVANSFCDPFPCCVVYYRIG
jgi:hypothetical protein